MQNVKRFEILQDILSEQQKDLVRWEIKVRLGNRKSFTSKGDANFARELNQAKVMVTAIGEAIETTLDEMVEQYDKLTPEEAQKYAKPTKGTK